MVAGNGKHLMNILRGENERGPSAIEERSNRR